MRGEQRSGSRAVRRALAAAAACWCAGALASGPVRAARLGDGEPFLGQQWGLKQIGAQDAWTVTRGAGVRIGVVDTGVDLAHEELAGGTVVASTRCMDTGGQVARCSGSAQDDNGHGTHVAGTIAAPLNGKGIAGVAPEASLLVVKALDAAGGGEAVDVAAAIDWLVAHDARVINLSLADATAVGQVIGSPIETAIRRAYSDHGVVFVLAGGNKADDGSTSSSAKGGYGDLPALVVAATGPEGSPARYNIPLGSARWGLAAPGGDGSVTTPEREIVSTYWYARQANGYAWSEGTSMAAPHVAAVAGLLVAQGLRGQAVVDRILSTLRPLDCGSGCRGSLDARAAVGAPVTPPTPSTTAPPATVAKQAPKPGKQAPAPPTSPTTTPPSTTPAPVVAAPPAPDAGDHQVDEAIPALPPGTVVVADIEARPVAAAAVAAGALVVVSGAAVWSSTRRRRLRLSSAGGGP